MSAIKLKVDGSRLPDVTVYQTEVEGVVLVSRGKGLNEKFLYLCSHCERAEWHPIGAELVWPRECMLAYHTQRGHNPTGWCDKHQQVELNGNSCWHCDEPLRQKRYEQAEQEREMTRGMGCLL